MARKTDIIFTKEEILWQCVNKVIVNQEEMTICGHLPVFGYNALLCTFNHHR